MNYIIWNFVKPFYKQDPTTFPDIINYTEPYQMSTKLHKRIWRSDGKIQQVVWYAAYDPMKREYSVPCVLEVYKWNIDPNTLMAVARTIVVKFFKEDGTTGGDDEMSMQTKFYTSFAEQLAERQQRNRDILSDVKELVVTTLTFTETKGDWAMAINMGTSFTEYLDSRINKYIMDGEVLTGGEHTSLETRKRFKWLDNDMSVMGKPGVRLWEVIHALIRDAELNTNGIGYEEFQKMI